jgi:hypothetical protein
MRRAESKSPARAVPPSYCMLYVQQPVSSQRANQTGMDEAHVPRTILLINRRNFLWLLSRKMHATRVNAFDTNVRIDEEGHEREANSQPFWICSQLFGDENMKVFLVHLLFVWVAPIEAINGATLRLETFNSWKAFEIITERDNPTGSWELPDDFDGAGAWLVDSNTLRVVVNHENEGSTISEVNIDFANFKKAIVNTIATGRPNVNFVQGARQAYDRWSTDLGETLRDTSGPSDTAFVKFCSGQAYEPHTFGRNRGFVDHCYITGEEEVSGRLFVIDLATKVLYQLSGAVGSVSNAGNGGMPFDAWENAALLDTGETSNVALLLSPDGGSEDMKLYIGHKDMDKNCNQASSPLFLERNGMACGSWYYLIGVLPERGGENFQGGFSTSSSGALTSGKLEDIDTSPSQPNKVVLGDETSGVFVLEFNLDFGNGGFNPSSSSFVITNIVDQVEGTDGVLNDADNVDWTASTTLGGQRYSGGLIFVNEDEDNGEVWQINPDGSNPVRVARANAGSGTSGIFDLSKLVGYRPASILICNNKGDPSSMSVLINPNAELLASPTAPPTRMPTSPPTLQPTRIPTPSPTFVPSSNPSNHPTTPLPTTKEPASGPVPPPTTPPTSKERPTQLPSMTEPPSRSAAVGRNVHLSAWIALVWKISAFYF